MTQKKKQKKTNLLYISDSKRYIYILSPLVNDLHPKIKLNLQSVFLIFFFFKVISKNISGWWVLQRYDAGWQSGGQYFTHERQQNQSRSRFLTKLGLLVVFTTVLVTTPQFSFLLVFTVSCHIVLSQQHGLLHGKRLLCVPVVWSSKQLGKLLP